MKINELPWEVRRKIRSLERERDRLMDWIMILLYLIGAEAIAVELWIILCIIAD